MKKKMLCVGEMMADLVAFPIEKVLLESDYHPMDSFWVKTGGDAHNNAVDLARLEQTAPAFDTVVNTIPAPVLTEAVLAALRPGSLIVDLASRPGGTDFAAARRLGHRAIHALSLPAACAPETAGEALARTVCEILAEREETP